MRRMPGYKYIIIATKNAYGIVSTVYDYKSKYLNYSYLVVSDGQSSSEAFSDS